MDAQGRRFKDRREAGRALAQDLLPYANRDDVIVLGLPRGGVPVAYEVARELHAPLDVLIVRKLGVPGHEEYGFGALAAGDVTVLHQGVISQLGLAETDIAGVIEKERRELERRERQYRGERPFPDLKDKIVILVDDGLATGASMRAAAQAVERFGPARIVIGAPTGSSEACMSMEGLAHEVVCSSMPSPFHAVGAWYADFSQTSDEEVRELLFKAS